MTRLLFVTLFYVYPLKFLFALITSQVRSNQAEIAIQPRNIPALMIIYGLGYAAVHLLFALLHLHAYRKRKELELTATELLDTQVMTFENLALMAIGLASANAASLSTPAKAGLSGWIYMLIGPTITIFRSVHGRRRRKLEARLERETSSTVAEASSAVHA